MKKDDVENNVQMDNWEPSPSVFTMQLLKYSNDKFKQLKSLNNYNVILEIFN